MTSRLHSAKICVVSVTVYQRCDMQRTIHKSDPSRTLEKKKTGVTSGPKIRIYDLWEHDFLTKHSKEAVRKTWGMKAGGTGVHGMRGHKPSEV